EAVCKVRVDGNATRSVQKAVKILHLFFEQVAVGQDLESSKERYRPTQLEQLRCCCDGEIFPAQSLDQPILEAMHDDLPTAEFAFNLGVDFGGLVQCEAVAMRRVADHDVTACSAELVGQALHLVHAVQFVIHWHHQCQYGTERLKHNGGFN